MEQEADQSRFGHEVIRRQNCLYHSFGALPLLQVSKRGTMNISEATLEAVPFTRNSWSSDGDHLPHKIDALDWVGEARRHGRYQSHRGVGIKFQRNIYFNNVALVCISLCTYTCYGWPQGEFMYAFVLFLFGWKIWGHEGDMGLG